LLLRLRALRRERADGMSARPAIVRAKRGHELKVRPLALP
jgi:hypothetical protein